MEAGGEEELRRRRRPNSLCGSRELRRRAPPSRHAREPRATPPRACEDHELHRGMRARAASSASAACVGAATREQRRRDACRGRDLRHGRAGEARVLCRRRACWSNDLRRRHGPPEQRGRCDNIGAGRADSLGSAAPAMAVRGRCVGLVAGRRTPSGSTARATSPGLGCSPESKTTTRRWRTQARVEHQTENRRAQTGLWFIQMTRLTTPSCRKLKSRTRLSYPTARPRGAARASGMTGLGRVEMDGAR